MAETENRGILESCALPEPRFEHLWDAVIVEAAVKDRLLAQAVLNFTLRGKLERGSFPLHGIILLVGPPGTGKTSLARGLASRTAASVGSRAAFRYLEVEPHALASSNLGKSQQAVKHLLGTVIGEQAQCGPLITVLDEVETLAADRSKMSLEANPVDVHRATDALLAQLDQLAASFPSLLFVATSNFPKAIDAAFMSRADLVVTIGLPGEAACEKILADTLKALANVAPKTKHLLDASALKRAAKECVGLDGRRIRKAVISALTYDKQTAIDPNRLKVDDVFRAIQDAQQELRLGGKAWLP